jgi:RimJ/RimL family protein N-acetyltransferase
MLGEGPGHRGGRDGRALRLRELGLERIIAIIRPENAASRRVAEKAGLTLRGETRWRGNEVVWYAVDRDACEAKKPTGWDAG